ncbi:MAG: rane protein [Chloroflexia bacterium]|jgi:membrane protein|nr:rane protein [Chloroflexia bacterium]
MNFKAIFDVLKDTFKDFGEDKVPRLAAALAYYTIFSIGPLLLIAISVASLLFDQKQVQEQMLGTIGGLVGESGKTTIAEALKNANKGGGNIIAASIGIVTLLLGASGVFGQLKDALNTIWEVKPKEGQGILGILRERFLSFTMVLGTGFLLLVSLVVSAGIAALGAFLKSVLPGGDIVSQIVNIIITLGIITLMFVLLFKFLPDVQVAWKDVVVGAFFTAVLFTVGQIALGLYLGSGSVGTAFGGAGSIVIILVWIYYSALIFFIGAELTQVYARRFGSRVVPSANAEPLTEEARAQEGIPSKDGGDKDRKRSSKDKDKDGPRSRILKGSPWFR